MNANAKIERAVEAVENLTVAVVAAQSAIAGLPAECERRYNDVRDARKELRTAFGEFLAPVLRVVNRQ